jgi:excisionase family DNA binding protein
MATDTSLDDLKLLTVEEIATVMRVSKMTVYRLIHSGELDAIRIGRSFRVAERTVSGYLRNAVAS